MTTLLNPPELSGLGRARDAVRAAAGTQLWSLTDRELAVEIGQRRYDALIELGRRALHHPATSSGDGGKAQIRVTIPLTSLTHRIGHGVLDDGTQISPTLARMLACDAGIIPATLGTHGQPIDPGRERRPFTGPARTAIDTRDGGCVWPGRAAADLTEGDSERASQPGTSKERSERGAEQCGSARSTTSSPGPRAVRPIRTTAACSAGTTTAKSNNTNGTPSTTEAGSGSDHPPD